MASKAIERDLASSVGRSTAALLLALSLIGLLYMMAPDRQFLATYFLLEQDLPVLFAVVLFALAIQRLLGSAALTARLRPPMTRLKKTPTWVIAALVALLGLTGRSLVFGGYPLSMDEFWALADGRIFAHGAPMARIPAEWLPYAPALQPFFLRLLPHAGLWSSIYLPVNGLMQMALGPFASPLMAAISVLLMASVARQLMPDRRRAPAIAALLLASSSQFLVTAMTPYAMSAHLAFNLAWLSLFLRRSTAAQLGAMAVGFLASGLHQFVFFPLFAAPFIAEALLSRPRLWPVAHGLAIALGVLVWSNYDGITAALMGVTPAPGAARDTGELFWKMLDLVGRFNLNAIGLMSLNLLRFVLWQNPLALPLMLLAAPRVIREPGPLRAAVIGVVLVPLFMLFVLPSQGHGWGYRYLHGQLGNMTLLATYGFYRIEGRDTAQPSAAFVATLAFSLVALLPLRAYQAWRQVEPYAAADRALKHVDADIVVIDAPNRAYAWDLVRNDPFLANAPKRMVSLAFSSAQLAQLCKRFRVKFFTDEDAARFGIPALDSEAKSTNFPHAGCG